MPLAATYLSGTPAFGNEGTSFTGITLDSQSNVFLGGMTGPADFPLQNPFTPTLQFSTIAEDMILAEMSSDLSQQLSESMQTAISGETQNGHLQPLYLQ